MYIAPYLNLAKYGNARGDMRFTRSTDQLNTYHVDDIMKDGRAFCNYSTSLNFEESAEKDLLEQLGKVMLMVAQ